MSTTDTEGTCCPTHRDACRFGREHFWSGPFLLDGGKPVNGEAWSHPDDVRCHVCQGVCSGNRPSPDTERDERLREALEEARRVADLYGNPAAVGLDDEVVVHPLAVLTLAAEAARLDAVVTAVREVRDEHEDSAPNAMITALDEALDGGAAPCDHDRRTTYEDPNHRAWVCQHCGAEGTEDKT